MAGAGGYGSRGGGQASVLGTQYSVLSTGALMFPRPGTLTLGSRSLLQWHVRHVVLADVDLLRPEDAVVLELFQPVRQPADHARDGEDRREQVARDAQGLVDDAGVEVHVGVDALGPVNARGQALQLDGHLV